MQDHSAALAIQFAEWHCCQVVLRFTGHFDAREFVEMEQYFAPDGVWHRADGNIESRDGLRRSMNARPPGLFVRHVITNLRASIISASEAIVQSYVTVYRHDLKMAPVIPLKLEAPVLFGRYSDKLRNQDSQWLIAERRVTVEMVK